MTEIPEHLLRRSRERREALGLSTPGDDAAPAAAAESTAVEPADAAAAPAAAAVAPAPARPPAPAPPPPPKPDPPYVQAAKRRRRIPAWAMPVLVALPVWGFIYANTLEPPTRADDPLTVGRTIYNGQCATCHGARGGGGAGPALTDGDTVLTFPDFRDHIRWVQLGARAGARPDGTYGEGGDVNEFTGDMPAFGELSIEELFAVVRYERQVLSGHNVEEEEPELFEASEGIVDPTEILEGGGESESGG